MQNIPTCKVISSEKVMRWTRNDGWLPGGTFAKYEEVEILTLHTGHKVCLTARVSDPADLETTNLWEMLTKDDLHDSTEKKGIIQCGLVVIDGKVYGLPLCGTGAIHSAKDDAVSVARIFHELVYRRVLDRDYVNEMLM